MSRRLGREFQPGEAEHFTKTPLAQNPTTRLQLTGKKPSPMGWTMAGIPLPCDIGIDWTSRNQNSNTNTRFLSKTGPPTTSSLQDPLACLLSDTQSAKGHLGHIKDPEEEQFTHKNFPSAAMLSSDYYYKDRLKPQVVGDGANADSELAGVALLLQVPHKASQREWGTVDPGKKSNSYEHCGYEPLPIREN